MKFMIIVKATKDSEAGVMPPESLLMEMAKYHEELQKAVSEKMAVSGGASTLAFELSDGGQRLVVNCGGPGTLPA